MKKFFVALPLMAALAACGSNSDNNTGNAAAPSAAVEQITGAGSTFVYPVLAAWSADYAKAGNPQINYQSIGSGGGITQVKAGTVDFGATDQPLDPKELAEAGLAQFPVVIGGIVPVINVPGIEDGKLKLDGETLANIFLGKVKKWNDPAIAALNPGMTLPDADIAVVHRSDGSGTSYNFTHYLSQVSGAWKAGPGEGKSVNWPVGVGGKGNEGVANYVRQIKNSIGYVEYAYVVQNKMNHAALKNAAGNFPEPSAATFQAAADSADWANAKDFFLVMTNAPGADAYPITATTFVLMPRQPKDKAHSDAAIAFFKWALENGQQQANKLDYVPLPASLVQQIETYVGNTIK